MQGSNRINASSNDEQSERDRERERLQRKKQSYESAEDPQE